MKSSSKLHISDCLGRKLGNHIFGHYFIEDTPKSISRMYLAHDFKKGFLVRQFLKKRGNAEVVQ